jgi:hypothetical protein
VEVNMSNGTAWTEPGKGATSPSAPAPLLSVSVFESVVCSRCGGGGHYSFCPSYGTRCFKCAGKGWTLTKRGAAANEFLAQLLTVAAADLIHGQRFLLEGVPGFTASVWSTVEEIVPDPLNPGMIRVEGSKGSLITGPACRVRVNHTAAEKAPKIAAALAFQATLTKTGTIRKRAA